MHALVVDDSKAVRSILSRMLGELDFEIDEANDGRDAINKMRHGLPIDLITLNWVMPHVNGLEFLKTVRADAKYRNIPILVVSGDESEKTIELAMSAGANAFLPKPVARQTLEENLIRLGLRSKNPSIDVTSSAREIPQNISPRPNLPSATPRPPKSLHPIRVMIVDDSVVVRGVVNRIIQSDSELQVVASAADGRIAMQKLENCAVDVVLLDIEMPNMNGFETLKAIRKLQPKLPVIMFSSLTTRGAKATIDAMMLGASDYVPKPGGSYMSDTTAGQEAIEQLLLPKIKQFGRPKGAGPGSKLSEIAIPIAISTPSSGAISRLSQNSASRKPRVVAIGVSTGGPAALAELLPKLVPQCPVPILIVQHMPPTFTGYLADRLRDSCGISIREAVHDELVQPGHVHLAPGGRHLSVKSSGGQNRIAITDTAPENACRPSADVLFRSIAKVYGDESLTIVLTGMGSDGTRGCELIHNAGGRIIVQDEASSVVWGMPGNVFRAGYANKVLPLTEIASEALLSLRVGVKK